VIAPIARDVADTALAFEVMAGPDPRDSDSVAVASDQVGTPDLRIAFRQRWDSTLPIETVIAERLLAVVEHFRESGLQITTRDPVWPPDATEEAFDATAAYGLARPVRRDFIKDPGPFDPDSPDRSNVVFPGGV